MVDILKIETADVILDAQEPEGRTKSLDRIWAGDMFEFADEDYVCYWTFSHIFRPEIKFERVALYHLAQAFEKYLKAFYMVHLDSLPRDLQWHRIVPLLKECARVEPALGHRSLEVFCRWLQRFNQLGRYPETKGHGFGLRRLTADVDRALIGLRTLASAAAHPGEKQLVERIADQDLEWDADLSTGFMTAVGGELAPVLREALRAMHPEGQ